MEPGKEGLIDVRTIELNQRVGSVFLGVDPTSFLASCHPVLEGA